MSQTDINKVKLSVDKNIGSKGVICQTYPSIFLIQVENKLDNTVHTISFSYTDVLTKDVQMQLI